MNSTTRLRETDDPHDAPAIAPDVVPVTWADRVLADITRDAKTIQPDRQPHAPAPAVDTTFRAAAVNRSSRGKWVASATMAFLFALGSAFAAAGWQHYGDRAKEVVAEWAPIATQFLASSPPADQAVPVEHAAAPADQAAAVDQAAPPAATAAQPAEAAASAAAASSPSESAELIQSMARDLAAMGQQVEQLKASIAELKANQQPATPVVARTSEAKPAEIRPPASAPVARPKVSAALPAPPPRPAPPPVRRPPPVQAGVAAPMPLTYQPPPPPPPAPPVQATARPDEEPVVRPPMPLRWGGAND
jgi:hypothetical protein